MDIGESGLVGDDGMMMNMIDEIDWEHLLDDVPEKGLDFFDAPDFWEGEKDQAAAGTIDSWMGDLKRLLVENDDEGDDGKVEDVSNDFQFSEILLDSPEEQRRSSSSGLELEVFDASSSPDVKNSLTCSDSEANVDAIAIANANSNTPDEEMDAALELNHSKEEDTDDDPSSKKRKRQLRNRDAAMRSRERKKMYVKDLEMKSRYLEAECRRLGRLLQCCYAENQMLRFSLQSGTTFGTSMANPESAVLLLESLLLGSLVWLMGLMCLHPLARLLLLGQDAVAVASVNRKEVESAAAQRRKGVKAIEVWLPLSFLRSKRCKASRTKMKCCSMLMPCHWLGKWKALSRSTLRISQVC